MTTVRLSKSLEARLDKLAKKEKKSKSEIIKSALLNYFKENERVQNPYELGKELFGRYSSSSHNLSQNYKKILKDKYRAKHSH